MTDTPRQIAKRNRDGDAATPAPGRKRTKPQRRVTPAEAREIVYTHGKDGLIMLCKIASGEPIYRVLNTGSLKKEYPSIDQMLKAQTTLIGKMLPDMKITDMQVDVKEQKEDLHDTRHTARVLLNLLGQGLMEGITDITPEGDETTPSKGE